MTTAECKSFQDQLATLFLDPEAVSDAASAHTTVCDNCRKELEELRATMTLLDIWTAPEPSAFFNARLHARFKAEVEAEPEGFWERISSYMKFSTGRTLRPALVGALGFAMLLGGGTAATYLASHGSASSPSPTVNDLKIYDNNAQAVDQMDLLDDASPSADGAPQS